jgi:hypothetical protein
VETVHVHAGRLGHKGGLPVKSWARAGVRAVGSPPQQV